MGYIPKINGYSLTDFHDFDECKFRFFVRHDLDHKYEIASGSEQMALGVILDRAIKEVHRNREKGSYKAPVERLVKSVRYAVKLIQEEEKNSPKRPNFSTAVVGYFTEDVIVTAESIFKNYCEQMEGKFKQAIFDIGFCKWVLKVGDQEFVLWGGPDTVEMGLDGIPEVIDYKSRQNITSGKTRMDMELMPKMYMLLTLNDLRKLGFKKARFKVIFWQDPQEETFFEEFDLSQVSELENIFADKIKIILDQKEIDCCGGKYCDACNSEKREEFIKELNDKGFKVMI
jgi:hypothetical protein